MFLMSHPLLGSDSDSSYITDLCSSPQHYPCIVVESKLHTNPYHFLMMAVFLACVACFINDPLLVSIEAVYTCMCVCVIGNVVKGECTLHTQHIIIMYTTH